MPDLEYNITANVEGGEDVAALKDDLGAIAENPTVTVDATGLQDAATASSDLATGLGDTATAAGDVEAPLESAGGLADIFGDKFSIASIKALGVAGALDILGQAIDLGRKAWEAYNAKQTVTDETTRGVSDALTDQAGALGGVIDRLHEIAGTDAATPVERLTSAITEGIDPEELAKIVSALGVVNLELTDLPPTLQAIEAGGDGAVDALAGLAVSSGIPPELADGIARAVLESEDMSGITTALTAELNINNGAAEDLVDTYGTQIGALEQLNDAQQNIDLESIAADQLEVARGTDTATAALVAQAEAAVGPDASALDVWGRYAELQVEATIAAEGQAAAATLQAQELQEAAAGAIALNDAMGGVDWQQTEIEGATSAMSGYTDQLFAAGNQAEAREAAFDALAASVEGVGLTFTVTSEAGRAQQDALEGVARVVDTDLATAYDEANGSQEVFMATATRIGEETLARLTEELDLNATEVNTLRQELGLTEGDYQARFELAGAEEARLKLGLLSGAIEGLPASIETTVNTQIIAGDYVGALATIQAYYADPSNAPTSTVEVEANTAPATDDIEAAANADHPHAKILADADTIQAADDLLTTAAEPRTALIVAVANNQAASAALESLTNAERTAIIDVATGSISLPSRFDLAASIGTIRVPVQAYWTTRIEGNRPGP